MTVRPASFTAHRVIRVMTKVCAAREIGLDGFALVSLIGHQWDAVRYRRPVAYHLADLMNLCGVKHKTAFYRIERRALAAGWLMKKIRGRRQPSVYWVAIPSQYADVEDTATVDEDDEHAADVSQSVSQSVSTTVHQSVSQSVSPFIPSPLPLPSPGPVEPGADVFDTTTPQAPPEAIAAETRWRYERLKPWVEQIATVVGTMIHARNWPAWARLVDEKHWTLEQVIAAADGLPAVKRWPDQVETALADVPRRGAVVAMTARTLTPYEAAEVVVHDLGWKACRARLSTWCHARVTDEKSLLDVLYDCPDEAAHLIAQSKASA